MEVYCTLQTGKALLEWKFYCQREQGERQESVAPPTRPYVKLSIRDAKGVLVLEGRQCIWEEELFKAILLHPHLWNGTRDPYLYEAEAFLIEEEKEAEGRHRVTDRISFRFPIHSFREDPGKGWLLNDELFCRKAVRYQPAQGEELRRELLFLLEAGVNTLCVEELYSQPPSFYETCRELGLVVWAAGTGQEVDSRFFTEGGIPTDLFYYHKARWSREAFVYISRESLKQQSNGNFSITVYSNCKKVALYVEGTLFEFQSGQTEFVFREIPFQSLFLCLSAEAEDCTMSLSIHRTFTKDSLFHDN